MEVGSSFNSESIATQKEKMVKKSSYNPDPTPPEQQSRKSSESHTATFASRPDHKKKLSMGDPLQKRRKMAHFSMIKIQRKMIMTVSRNH